MKIGLTMTRNKNSRTFLCRRWFATGSLTLLAFLSNAAILLASEGEEATEGAGLNPLVWKSDLAIWTAVVFLLLLFILGKFAFGPIVKSLDAREQKMLDQVNNAEKANADAKELLRQYQQKLTDSEREVRQMLDDAKAQAKKVGEDIVAQARVTAEEEHQKALKEIQSASDNALADLAAKSADLATSLAGKILKEKINPADHAELINSAINEFSKN